MEFIISIKDGTKAKAFLNFLKSLDFITILENKGTQNYPTLSEQEIVDRVALTNEQIKQGKTISHEDLTKEVKNW
jgi:hypothetical protein